ncbi:MAG: hypothetical protein H7270_03700 [Dermatophilaceae bacterium]|nr:hypothetical protein [Dermatophilaceae bacterium]
MRDQAQTLSLELPSTPPLRPAVGVFILVAVAASIFWATATVAQWSGLELAQYRALHLDELPSVILDTRERLFLTSPGINEIAAPVRRADLPLSLPAPPAPHPGRRPDVPGPRPLVPQ